MKKYRYSLPVKLLAFIAGMSGIIIMCTSLSFWPQVYGICSGRYMSAEEYVEKSHEDFHEYIVNDTLDRLTYGVSYDYFSYENPVYEYFIYTVYRDEGRIDGEWLNLNDYEKMPLYENSLIDFDNSSYRIVTAIRRADYNDLKSYYNEFLTNGTTGLLMIFGGFLIAAAAFVYLMISAGRTASSPDKIKMLIIDKPAPDLLFAFYAAVTLILLLTVYSSGSHRLWQGTVFYYIVSYLSCMFLYTVWIHFWTMTAKKIKRGSFLKTFFVYKIYRRLKSWFYLIAKKNTNNYDFIMFIAVNALAAVFIYITSRIGFLSFTNKIIAIAGIIAAFSSIQVLIVKKRNLALKSISDDIENIRSGNLDYKVKRTGVSTADKIADNVNHISEGMKIAAENQLKSERLKVELITNVSHDLKTPLTSMINYIDLLKNEKCGEQSAKHYIDIIDGKTQRLKTLVDDLFDIAKANSGNIKMQIEKICFNELINQTIAENEHKISYSGLDFRLDLPEQDIYIKADGNRLWRVIDNLVSNAVKYSLKGTRVYITLFAEADKAVMEMKNIAGYEMDFSSDEIVERFARGDKSRSAEGSGLGLSIAKSFTELQNGSFNVIVDGDMFKAVLKMPLYK